MKEYIVRCENNKFTLEGEIVRCKDCGHRIVTDWYKYDKGMTRSVYNCDKNIINDNKDSDSCSYGKRKAVTEETDTDQNEVVDFNNMISAGGRIRNLLNGVAQIKVNTDEIVKRAKEKYEITDCPVCEDAISIADSIKAREGKQTMSDRLLKESDVMRIAYQLPYVVNSAFFDAVKALPSADRPQGKWIVSPLLIDNGRVELECPECGDIFIRAISYRPHFCENCGADMRGDKE